MTAESETQSRISGICRTPMTLPQIPDSLGDASTSGMTGMLIGSPV